MDVNSLFQCVINFTDSGEGKLELHADLSGLVSFHCNDLLVDSKGCSYVGNFAYDLHAGESVNNAEIILVCPDRDVIINTYNVLRKVEFGTPDKMKETCASLDNFKYKDKG